MKRIFSLFCLLLFVLGVRASEPNDYVYATALQYDEEFELYYFDVILQGENKYTAYGMDIQLPNGMEVVEDEYGIFVEMIKDIYPTYGRNKEYTHSVTPAFPYPDDHSHLRVGCMSSQNLYMEARGILFRVYVTIDYAANSWPIGAIKLYDVELNKVGAPYNAPVKETAVSLHTGETTLPLSVSVAAKWSTCVLPFSTEIPKGVTAYTCSSNDEENIYLTKAESFEAYTPYILHSENGYSGNISGVVDAEGCPANGVSTDGYLIGAVVPQTVKEGCILQKHGEDVKFYAIGEGDSFVVPAGKCWMNIPEAGVKAFNFVVNNDETGVQTTLGVKRNSNVYDLTGRRVSTMKKSGLYIKNGEKYLSK